MVVEDLQSVQTKWEAIGQALYTTEETLEDIRTQCSYAKPGDGLREVLRLGLPTYWHHFVAALRSIGEEHLAKELKEKYGELSTPESLLMCTDAEFDLNTVDIRGANTIISKWLAL